MISWFGRKKDNPLQTSADTVGKDWAQNPYYANAESKTQVFWSEKSAFAKLFSELDLANTLELACGHGRHAEIVAPRADHLTLMDIHDANLDACRQRLSSASNISYHRNNGYNFRPLTDASVTAVYCYDAMVHFAPDVVQSYLSDTARVLTRGGRALYHHSNYPAPLGQPYSKNPHARNHMTKELFAQHSTAAGLAVLKQHLIRWGDYDDLDCITLVERPR